MTECWLRAGMLFGGACFALAPVGDTHANVMSYKYGYQRKLDAIRARKGWNAPETEEERHAIKALDFLRDMVSIYRDPGECFKAVAEYAEGDPGDGSPQFSLLIDEGAVARKESPILESVGPLARNLKGIVYITGHRSMAMPPAIRAVRRATVLWRSSDGTGDEELERIIDSIPGFQYSPVMGEVKDVRDKVYRGIRYLPTGPEPFAFNPYTQRMPDWMLLPALPTAITPRTLTL